MSSINPTAVVVLVSNIGRSVLTKKRKSIGERVKPCGIPVLVDNRSPLNDPNIIDIFLTPRKDLIQRLIHFVILFSLRL